MSISASMVKDLREKTGAGMMDCKKALEECGDMEKAVDWLRQKGLSKAAKRADRATSEGVIALRVTDNYAKAAMAELACETDFVSRGDAFQAFAKSTVNHVFEKCPQNAEELTALLGGALTDMIASTGENMTLGRFLVMEARKGGVIGTYVHSNGKIGVLVDVAGENEATASKPELIELAKNVAMQIAAAAPLALAPEDLDAALIEREREVYRQKAKEEGKPDNIIDKIADGAVKKYYKEVCLLEQPYIKDDKLTIRDLLKNTGKTLGDNITISRFIRMQLGAE